MTMAGRQKYTGGCHCGRVRYEVWLDLESTVICNCSICQKTGTILSFAPAADFKLMAGENDLSDYQFNKRVIHHLFCRTCGIRSFSRGRASDGSETYAVNVRCLDGADPASLEPKSYDGRSL